jgi:alcohol dehydrogenase (cytochrome c)
MLVATSTLCMADEVGEGRDLYQELCSKCHGNEMANPGLAFDLRKFPKDDPERFRQSVLSGKGQGMPAWKDQLSAEDVKSLWAYVQRGG